MPDASGTGWIYAVWDPYTSDPEATVSAHCLARSQFGELATVFATDEAPPDHGGPAPILFASARCPAGFYAYAGGAFLHRPDTATPEWVGYLTASSMTADDRGWYARGWTFAPGAQVSAVVQCMTRIIDQTT